MAKKINEQRRLSESELDILKSFFPKAKDITLKEIMQKSGYTYEPVNRIVHNLAKKEIISERKFGKTFVYNLNTMKLGSKVAFYIYETERTSIFSEKNNPISRGISEIPEEDTDLIMVFGSHAKGTARKDSDIDLLIVSPNKEKVEIDLTSIRRRYGIAVHPIILPRTEFAKIKNENPELWNSLIQNGIIFKGYELFYHYAYAE